MIVKASDQRTLSISGVSFQLFGLTVITWSFLIPAPLSIQILIALSVTFSIAVVEHIQNRILLSQKEDAARNWLYTLLLQMAINKMISNAGHGLYDPLDWRQLTQEALEDIKSAQEDDRLQEKISSRPMGDWLAGFIGMLIVFMAFPGVGYLIAMLIKMFVPGMSEGL